MFRGTVPQQLAAYAGAAEHSQTMAKPQGAPAVREDHAAAEDGHGHAAELMQLLQLHLARPLGAAVPARMRPRPSALACPPA